MWFIGILFLGDSFCRPKIYEELDKLRVQRASDESFIKELQLTIVNNIAGTLLMDFQGQ